MSNIEGFVDWFRGAAPYINAHRDRTFVIQFGGEALLDPAFPELVHDLALLDSLGIRLVLVHGARPQIDSRLADAGHAVEYVRGLRVTTAETIGPVLEAVGAARIEIEALLSMGLANSPMAGARLRVASGNVVTARPIGIRSGVDFQHTGQVRRIDGEGIRRRLDEGAIVLVSPLGYSPTGEVFNIPAEQVATEIAIELKAAKLLFLVESDGLEDDSGALIAQLGIEEAKHTLAQWWRGEHDVVSERARLLAAALHACRNGVNRTHLVDRSRSGALLLELFTRDGIGTMVNADPYDAVRRAGIDDVGGILELIAPMESEGALVRRSRERLETEIDHYLVVERDGTVIACAAIHPFAEQSSAEFACLAVHPDYRKGGWGDRLLEIGERDARAGGAEHLFVLTTQAVHWFKERGFVDVGVEALPVERRADYDSARRSRVLRKLLV